ncbi:COP9 signalosome complex subunit 3-like [Rhagoletis pomonella]|uniref:COP9 signalosome complex subunit 3-like n=1 Tax=Rhagoletis pomonella TaxID=28610 RepID=UPI0017869EDB|nr:COP9 signalosome complex subunit 3-like [Rhagoletis pomonella]XP_036346314.1 COP9 signalosome complex subunit 3-like [Rhagoletis pomonella]
MATALENYVNNVRTKSSEGNFRIMVEQLNDSVEVLSRYLDLLDNVLETLDFQQHSLGVLYVLLVKFNGAANANADLPQLFNLYKEFISQCNGEQVRYATYTYYDLCHMFTNLIVDHPYCIQGIKVVAQAIEKIRLCDSQQTSIHSDLCQLSLKSKCFKTALSFLDVDITTISTASEIRGQNSTEANNDAKYFLLYYYYGGMIYTAVKNFDRALYFFEVCISTPAAAMSHIMLEAYKKFLLVSLILHGKVLPIPKYSAQVISRFMKPLAQAYHDLATAYSTSSSDELRIVMNKSSDTFTRDKNMGLVKQVVTSLYKKNIQRLTKTFLTLSLSDVASRAQLADAAEAEKYIFNMIKSGEIYATINKKDGMVVFKDDPEKYNSPEMFLKIQEDMAQTMELIRQINKMEEEILLNPLYVKKALGNQEDELTSQHAKSFSGDPTD